MEISWKTVYGNVSQTASQEFMSIDKHKKVNSKYSKQTLNGKMKVENKS